MENLPLSRKYIPDDKFLNALAEAYRLQEAIISATELAIISTSPDGSITSFNQAAEKLLGFTADELIGKHTPVLFHDPDEIVLRAKELTEELHQSVLPGFDAMVIKPRLHKTSERREWTYISKNGKRIPVVLSVSALWDEKELLIGYAGIATDITEQKKIEEKVRSSEAHLQVLLNSIEDIVFEVNRQRIFTNVWTKHDDLLLVQPREHYIGKTLSEVLPEPLSARYEEAITRVFATQSSQYIEYPLERGNRWNASKISFIDQEQVIIFVRDITTQKQAEFLLRESEKKFRLMAENMPGAIYLCRNDETYSMVYLNERVKDITGYGAEEFVSGKISFVNLYHPEDAAGIISIVDDALATRKSFLLEYRILHRSGEVRWIKEVGAGIYEHDKLLMIEGIVTDITAQKNAEAELLKVAEENYRLFNNSVNLSAIASFDGYFKKLNPAWQHLLGWTEEELKSKPLVEFIHPDDVEATVRAVEYIVKGNNLATFENRYRCRDGTYRWLLWGSGSDSKHELIYASAIDITERKKSEEELLLSKQNLETIALRLQEQNRQLDEFAHIISHNLRSPVGNIKALINFINDKSTIEDYRLIFEKIRNVSNNLGETMNELMETLKVKNDTGIERIEIRFKDILDKVVQSLEGELIQCGANVTYDFNSAPKIIYPKTYLESIFQNLLSNAIKYRSPDRQLAIHVSSDIYQDRTELRVRDNGLGIDLERFGEKLFGLHKTFHDNKEARGVGLFLTKTQIEAMGGTVTVESEVDKGTTFIIRF
ncbi:MAG TPA: PAS domain S-box protein [Ohtaekwangia sp.]|uniref:PAS domain-containing sensor histidine kinase n=1 Tax=Ohtaekwangia sp. TaxID=2066019 RepID=UPI002F9330E4